MSNAPLADVNRFFLGCLLPHTHGTEEQKKAAAKVDKTNEPTAAQKAERQDLDAMFDGYKFKSTVQLGDEAAFRAQNEAARAAAEPEVTPEQQAALDALKALTQPPAE